jgi:hypothetical protein
LVDISKFYLPTHVKTQNTFWLPWFISSISDDLLMENLYVSYWREIEKFVFISKPMGIAQEWKKSKHLTWPFFKCPLYIVPDLEHRFHREFKLFNGKQMWEEYRHRYNLMPPTEWVIKITVEYNFCNTQKHLTCLVHTSTTISIESGGSLFNTSLAAVNFFTAK